LFITFFVYSKLKIPIRIGKVRLRIGVSITLEKTTNSKGKRKLLVCENKNSKSRKVAIKSGDLTSIETH